MPTRSRTLAAAAAVAVVAMPTASAQAASRNSAEVASGQTMLRLDRGTARALDGAGVSVTPLRPGRNTRSGLTFPITGGRLNPATLRGHVDHSGGIRFRAGSTTVALRDFRYRIGKRRAALSADVGGDRLTIAHLDLRRARTGADGPLTKTARNIRATLTAGAASALNSAFDTHLFSRGLRIGKVRTEVVLGEAVLRGGDTTLALDAGAASALQSLSITPGVVGDATAGGDGLAFPITRGKVNAETLAGSVEHSGGISLTRGGTVVQLTDFTIGIDESPALSAVVNGGDRVEILTLDVANIERSVRGRTIVVSGVVASLTADAAGALNAAFGTTAFEEGLTLGSATLRARVR